MELVPSDEQQQVINKFKLGDSLQVITPAGGAKTTTSIMCIKSMPDKNILYLTYNTRLKEEIRKKVSNIKKCEAHSFHAWACKFYGKTIITDRELFQAIKSNKKFKTEFRFDILIVDEAQDINPIIYKFLRKVIKKCDIKQLMLIGDPKQSIYEFNKATSDYLEKCDQYFSFKFTHIKNNDTYRCSSNVTDFVNAFLDNSSDNLIKSKNSKSKSNNKIDYIIHNAYNSYEYIIKYIDKFGPDNIAILAPSVKIRKNQPLIRVINNIMESYNDKYEFYIPKDDHEKVNRDNYKGMVPCLTYHQTKGLEFKCVIIYGLDSAYDFYYNPEQIKIPNSIYVALTRSTEQLVIVASTGYNSVMHKEVTSFRLINHEKISHLINIRTETNNSVVKRHFGVKKNDIIYCKDKKVAKTTTEMTKHVDGESVNILMEYLESENLSGVLYQNNKFNDIDKSIQIKNFTDDISSYYGITIPLTYWFLKHKVLPDIKNILGHEMEEKEGIDEIDETSDMDTKLKIRSKILELYEKIKNVNDKDLNQIIFIIFKLAICIEGYDNYSNQYYRLLEWGNDKILLSELNFEFINECIERLNSLKLNETATEKIYIKECKAKCGRCLDDINILLMGRVDLEDEDTIYELKVKSKLSDSDILQSGVYSYLTGKTCILINVQTNEAYKIKLQNKFIEGLFETKMLYHHLTNRKEETIHKDKNAPTNKVSPIKSVSFINTASPHRSVSSINTISPIKFIPPINKENINGKSPARIGIISPIKSISPIKFISSINKENENLAQISSSSSSSSSSPIKATSPTKSISPIDEPINFTDKENKENTDRQIEENRGSESESEDDDPNDLDYIMSGSKSNISPSNLINLASLSNNFNKLILDTETTGLPLEGCYDNVRMVQLGWMIIDKDNNIIFDKSHIIKPDGFNIPVSSTRIHNITMEKAQNEGKPFKEVYEEFLKSIADYNAKSILSYGIIFDWNVLNNECSKNKLKMISSVPLGCIMNMAVKLLSVRSINLEFLYNVLFNQNYTQKHDALDDTKLAFECYKFMVSNNGNNISKCYIKLLEITDNWHGYIKQKLIQLCNEEKIPYKDEYVNEKLRDLLLSKKDPNNKILKLEDLSMKKLEDIIDNSKLSSKYQMGRYCDKYNVSYTQSESRADLVYKLLEKLYPNSNKLKLTIPNVRLLERGLKSLNKSKRLYPIFILRKYCDLNSIKYIKSDNKQKLCRKLLQKLDPNNDELKLTSTITPEKLIISCARFKEGYSSDELKDLYNNQTHSKIKGKSKDKLNMDNIRKILLLDLKCEDTLRELCKKCLMNYKPDDNYEVLIDKSYGIGKNIPKSMIERLCEKSN